MRRRFTAVITSETSDPVALLLNKFAGAGDEVAVRCNIVTATRGWILSQHIGNRRYFQVELYAPEALSAGNEWMSIRKMHIRTLYGGYNDQSTPAVSLNGVGWTTSAGSYPGGRLSYHATAGRYAEVVTPAGCTAVGAVGNQALTNAGLAKISIDGDATLATSLPTAQQLVDAGTYANTILVANGGSLNPTDRCWDQYNQTANYPGPPGEFAHHYEIFATGLSAAAHTVRITVTGYKRAAASAANVLFYLITAHGAGMSLNIASATYEACLLPEVDIYDITSTFPRNEISYNTKPTGATNYQWVGHTGSLKFATGGTPVITVDGVTKDPADDETFTGTNQIVVTQQLRVRHTEIGGGATEVGLLDLTFTFHVTTGLTISHTLNWSMGGVAKSYPCMFAIEEGAAIDRYQSVGSGAVASDLTAGDDSVNFNTSQKAVYAWDADGSAAVMMYIPDLAATVESWAKAGTNKLYWDDVTGGTFNKARANRFASDETFTADTVWTSEANYRAAWFTDGAANNVT